MPAPACPPETGRYLPDAWLAAALEQQAGQLASFDRDFKRRLPRSRFILLKP
jgi:predicted nucleic acid-binding protein